MALVPLIEYADASPEVRAVYDDIMATRKVATVNNCEYCIHSHIASARNKGMTPAMFHELMAVVALANETNSLSNGYRIDVDARFRDPLAS
jgi:AhpD family alkylhydroperoxidase